MSKRLDPCVQALVDELNGDPVTFEGATPEQQQRSLALLLARLQPDPSPRFEGTIRDDIVYSPDRAIPVRRYLPDDVVHASSVVVYMHGGGWVLGNLDTADRFARYLASGMGARVVSVDYRLATKAPFPAAFDDTLRVVAGERDEGADWIGVAGDSAGGNLAAAVALKSVREGTPVDAQLLIYPCLDATCSRPSFKEFADGYVLTASVMEYYWDTYARDADRTNEDLAPAFASSLKGAPPTVIATAGFDPLHDEGADFAQRLIRAGVRTTYLPFERLVHGFIDFTDRAEAARNARAEIVEAFAEIHHAQLAAR